MLIQHDYHKHDYHQHDYPHDQHHRHQLTDQPDQMPLDVDRGIELPQLELTHNFTGDCTTAYSTGSESWKTMMIRMRTS